jgi:hypothetical protein
MDGGARGCRYEPAEDVAAKAPQHFPAHLARIKEFPSPGENYEIREWNEILTADR